MAAELIDHTTLSRLVEAGAVHNAHVIGQKGGWGVLIRYGRHERTLVAQRSRRMRLFKKLETVVAYLKEVGLARFEVDAKDFDPAHLRTYSRPDRAVALKRAHEAAEHDTWLRAEVHAAITDQRPALPGAEVEAHFEHRKAMLRK